MRLVLLAIMLVASSAAADDEIGPARVFDSASSVVELTVMPVGPSDKAHVLLEITGAADLPSPLLMTKLTVSRDTRSYTSVGSVGVVRLEEGGERHTLVNGTIVDYVELTLGNASAQRLVLSKDKSAKVDGRALLREYQRAQGFADPANASEATIAPALKTAAQDQATACGGKPLQVNVDWPGFKQAGTTSWVGGIAAVFAAMKSFCSDADYRAALRKLRTVEVIVAPSIRFAVSGSTLDVSIGDGFDNVQLQAQKWLKANL
jgi:hypothetical protein